MQIMLLVLLLVLVFCGWVIERVKNAPPVISRDQFERYLSIRERRATYHQYYITTAQQYGAWYVDNIPHTMHFFLLFFCVSKPGNWLRPVDRLKSRSSASSIVVGIFEVIDQAVRAQGGTRLTSFHPRNILPSDIPVRGRGGGGGGRRPEASEESRCN